MDLMVKKKKIWQGNYIKNYITEIYQGKIYQKKMVEKGHVWSESGVMKQGRREVEAGTLLLDNDKNNVTAEKFFYCFW